MRRRLFSLFFLLLAFGLAANAQTPFAGIDVQHYAFALTLNDKNDTIKGSAAITIRFLNDAQRVQLNLVKQNSGGKGMLVSSVTRDGKPLKFEQDDDVISIFANEKGNTIDTFTVNYSGVPADGLIISTNQFGHRTFFGDNWPNRAHNWLPCADYPGDKASVDFTVIAPDHYQVVANGLKVEEKQITGHNKLTRWKEAVALPTKVMVIGVADFAVTQSGMVNGVPVYSYVFPENKDNGFKSYSYAPEILRWYMQKIGPYAYEKLANVQSKTIFGGMENASAIFYFEKSVGNKIVEELMAHEIAHQWFGDAVTEKGWANLWLSEGFATYMTDCYLEGKYGTDSLKQRLIKEREKVFNFEKTRFTPVLDTAVNNNYLQLLNANSYEKGSWVLHMLRRKLGDSLFWQGIRAYYKKDDGRNANTNDFEQVMEQVSGIDLKQFFNQWLRTAGHPDLAVNYKYDDAQHTIDISFTQKQDTLFYFPLTYKVNGLLYKLEIKDKVTNVRLAAKVMPAKLDLDPETDVLASFELSPLSR